MTVSRDRLNQIQKVRDEAQAIYDELCVQVDVIKQGIKRWDISDNIYGVQLPDGSYPLAPLLAAKAEAFSTLLMLVKDFEQEKERVENLEAAERELQLRNELYREYPYHY